MNPTTPVASEAPTGERVRPNQHDSVGAHAASIALRQVGAPYRYGGMTPTGFDCSGLVHYSYAHAGKNIPRTTAGQWANLPSVEGHNMRAGDLLFFSISGKMSHVGMYLGDGDIPLMGPIGKRDRVRLQG